MELKEFASLIACGSTNTAKNTMSYLIGNGLVNANWSNALAQLYKSYPEEIRTSVESKKEFFPVILKYFTIHHLTNENIEIYKMYEDLFSAKNKDDIKKFNVNWKWDTEPEIIFKNALAFTTALPNQGKFLFIKQYEKQFTEFIKKSKDKIYKHFTTQRVWNNLINENYYKFLEFCDQYDFDRIEILKDNMSQYTNLYNKNLFEQENIEFYLDDLLTIGKEHLNIITNFNPNSAFQGLNRTNGCTVMGVLIDCIGNHQYKSAIKWLEVFEPELNKYAQLYKVENINNATNFKQLLNIQIKEIKNQPRREYIDAYFLERILKNNDWFKFMESYTLFENLNEKLEPKLYVKAKKI